MNEILENTLRFAARQLRDLGFEHEFATRLHLVDGFPKPYDTMQATVLAVDEGDKLQFGIEPGVYFRSSPRPFYSEHIACHEIVHVALGHVSPMEFSSRLEEGIAEFLGAGYISLRHLGPKLTENIFVLNRLSRLLDPNWERYLEATRQIFVVAARTGLPGLVQIMNNGRSAINELEQETLVGEWSLEASSGFRHFDGDLLDLMSRVLLTYPRTLVASPAAVLLAPYLKPGTTMQEAATASGMDIDLATQAAQELQDDLGLLALRPDKIIVTFSQAHRVGDTSAMRYSSPD